MAYPLSDIECFSTLENKYEYGKRSFATTMNAAGGSG